MAGVPDADGPRDNGDDDDRPEDGRNADDA